VTLTLAQWPWYTTFTWPLWRFSWIANTRAQPLLRWPRNSVYANPISEQYSIQYILKGKKGKAEHLYSALRAIQTTLKRSGMDHTVLPAINPNLAPFPSYRALCQLVKCLLLGGGYNALFLRKWPRTCSMALYSGWTIIAPERSSCWHIGILI